MNASIPHPAVPTQRLEGELRAPDMASAVTVKRCPAFVRKVALLGDVSVGKTSLILALSGSNARDSVPQATVGLDYTSVSVSRDGRDPIVLELYDTAGSERFGMKSMSMSFVRTMDAVVFVYDIHDQHSLENVVTWKSAAYDVIGDQKSIATLLVANKADTIPSCEEYDQGVGLARGLRLGGFVDASAHEKRNIDTIASFILDNSHVSVIEKMRKSGASPYTEVTYFTSLPLGSRDDHRIPQQQQQQGGGGGGVRPKRIPTVTSSIIVVGKSGVREPGAWKCC